MWRDPAGQAAKYLCYSPPMNNHLYLHKTESFCAMRVKKAFGQFTQATQVVMLE